MPGKVLCMNKHIKTGLKILAVILAANIPFAMMKGVSADGMYDNYENNSKSSEYPLGTANTPEGTTIVISVFASDVNYSWDTDSAEDLATISRIDGYLKIATDYLTEACAAYDAEADFIYDFQTNDDLAYFADFEADTTLNDCEEAEYCMDQLIDSEIDTEALKEKYDADNIIYFMFVNTDEDNQGISCTRNYYEGVPRPYEIIFLFNIDYGQENCPAVFAHEMLHTFGALDLYSENEDYQITQEFVDWMQENAPNDIMYSCSDLETGSYLYDRITNEFTELDAYYVGLTDSCEIVNQFNLGASQHQ